MGYAADRLGELFRTATADNVRSHLAEAQLLADPDDLAEAGYIEGLVRLFRQWYPLDPVPGVDVEVAGDEPADDSAD
jgi:hypothetical protein